VTNSVRISKRVVDGLKPGDTVWDCDVRGFAVRRQKRARVYFLKARVRGKQRWLTIGEHGTPWTPETARHEAQRLWGLIRSGADIHIGRGRHTGAPTIADMCDRYLDEYATRHKKPSSVDSDRGNIANHIKPQIGSIAVADLTRDDVETLKRQIADGKTGRPANSAMRKRPKVLTVRGGPIAANRTLALLSKMFSLAEDWGWRPNQTNPCRRVVRFAERKSERFLTSDEIVQLASALDAIDFERSFNPCATAAIRILLLTGARVSEITELQWQNVDLERAMLHLPDSKTGARPVFLSEPAIGVFRALPRRTGNPFVFSSETNQGPVKNIQNIWSVVRDRAGLEGVRLHDLRHSFASIAAGNGASLPIIGRMLGHSTPLTTQRYAHLVQDTVRDANEEVGRRISKLFARI